MKYSWLVVLLLGVLVAIAAIDRELKEEGKWFHKKVSQVQSSGSTGKIHKKYLCRRSKTGKDGLIEASVNRGPSAERQVVWTSARLANQRGVSSFAVKSNEHKQVEAKQEECEEILKELVNKLILNQDCFCSTADTADFKKSNDCVELVSLWESKFLSLSLFEGFIEILKKIKNFPVPLLKYFTRKAGRLCAASPLNVTVRKIEVEGIISSVAISPDGMYLALLKYIDDCSYLECLERVDGGNNVESIFSETHDDIAMGFGWDLSGKTLALYDEYSKARFYNWDSGNKRFSQTSNMVGGMDLKVRGSGGAGYYWGPGGSLVGWGGGDNERCFPVLVYNEPDVCECLTGFSGKHLLKGGCVDWWPAGEHLVFCNRSNGDIKRWLVGGSDKKGSQSCLETKLPDFKKKLASIALSPSGEGLAYVDNENSKIKVFIFGSQSTTVLNEGSTVKAIAWQPGGNYLASACADGTVGVWDMKHQCLFHRFESSEEDRSSFDFVSWDPSGKLLAFFQAGKYRYGTYYFVDVGEKNTYILRRV